MKNDRIRDRLTPIQRIALLLVGDRNREPIRGKLWFQKEVFMIADNLPDLAEELDYEPAPMGPFSEALETNYDQLIGAGLLRNQGAKFILTPDGDELEKALRKETKKEEIALISDMKELLNDLEEEELLALVYFTHEDMTEESDKMDKLLPKRKSIAAKLFRKGKVGIEIGAKIAGLDVERFVSFLRKEGIAVYAE